MNEEQAASVLQLLARMADIAEQNRLALEKLQTEVEQIKENTSISSLTQNQQGTTAGDKEIVNAINAVGALIAQQRGNADP